ncbi:hypothetical protein MSG28_009081 [Choristoneura fumiferana]|uniref:Uncharacterized protein n=1 Tax=Choristoneura fumiferana TaxID=7141 RepID=A0ACC0KWS5_CHOFU|nr:hypothetical protein MSG28_009081 [Choristoneura fumiferana]
MVFDCAGGERITVQCPTCRLQCQPANMIDQRFVLEKLCTDTPTNNGGTEREQQCNSCEDTEPATSYCTDCAEFICDNCVQAHQRLKITKDHTIKSKEEATAELQAAQPASAHDMFCSEHPQVGPSAIKPPLDDTGYGKCRAVRVAYVTTLT